MPVIGTPRRFDLMYKFRVEIDGVGSANFKDCSELAGALGEALLWQGGSMTPIKETTRLTFSDITLTRGSSRDMDLWNWFKQGADAAANRGLPSPTTRRHGAIVQFDRANIPVERYDIFDVACKEYGTGGWDNDSDEFRMERIVISIRFFERVPLTPV